MTSSLRSAETCLRFGSRWHDAPWSAGTCPSFVSGRHVALKSGGHVPPTESEDMSSHSKLRRILKQKEVAE